MTPWRKHEPGAADGWFGAEAAGLRWLAAAGGARCVEVLGVGEDWIELEQLHGGSADPGAAEELGRALARTHAAGAGAFGAKPDGWDGPTFIGRQAQACEPTPTWGVFYAEQRVRPFARKAHRLGHLETGHLAMVDALCDRIATGEFDDGRPPARLHGDLWSGNVMWTRDGAVLIDPAAHGGHAETDLAMLALFGAPQLDRVLAAYDAAAPLADGWPGRVALHQLHPLAVHAASHGPSYGVALARAAAAYA